MPKKGVPEGETPVRMVERLRSDETKGVYPGMPDPNPRETPAQMAERMRLNDWPIRQHEFQVKHVIVPIQMVLFCPFCFLQHIDCPDPAKGWDNPPHRSHECQACGAVWRPADVETTGVFEVQTRGQRDTIIDGMTVPNPDRITAAQVSLYLGRQVMTPAGEGLAHSWDWSISKGKAELKVFMQSGGHRSFDLRDVKLATRPLTDGKEPA